MKRAFVLAATQIAAIGLIVALAAAASAQAKGGGAKHATAEIKNASGTVIGSAKFTEDGTGRVHVNVHVKGLTAGLHGIHIHGTADCEPFADAGAHYNPPPTHQHGLQNPAGPHAGDLPNLKVNAEGVGHLNAKTSLVTLSPGAKTLFDATAGAVNSALVIHANQDDQVTDPIGNSGARIACGLIVAK